MIMPEHWGAALGAGGGTVGLFILAFKDVFREWWRDRNAQRDIERKEKAVQKDGGAMAHELLAIINRTLVNNDTNIKDLTTTLKALTSAIEHLATITDSSHKLLSETRDNVIELKGRLN
jgi:hypothetical protein